jgi:Ca2+-binding RTX toxin-like protein
MAGLDRLDGGGGRDTASFQTSSTAVTADLTSGTGSGDGTYSFVSIESIEGSGRDDELIGNGANNFIGGGPGNDFIDGRDGHDTAVGGEGTDTCVNAEERFDCEST